jgi:hypothetical protein
MLLAAFLLLGGCQSGRHYEQAIAVLIDVSGTYADQKTEVVRFLKRDILPTMVPGDTLLVVRIDSQSYEKDNVEALLTLDTRPSRANAQKLALAQRLDVFAADDTPSRYTDLRGAMMLAAEYLKEIPSQSRVLLVFSDLEEDLPNGARREMNEGEFEGIRVVAMNVKRLQADGLDPSEFRDRVAHWEERVTTAGATGWRTFADENKVPEYLAALR